jgi:hypothetical protein
MHSHESAPALVNAFGADLAGRFAALAKAEPRLLARVAFAPRRAYGAYMIWASSRLEEMGVAAAAAHMYATDPAALLAEATDAASVAEVQDLYRMLHRVPGTLPAERYDALVALSRGPLARAISAVNCTIDAEFIQKAQAIARLGAGEPLVLDAAAVLLLAARKDAAQEFVASLQFLRAHGRLDPGQLAAKLRGLRDPDSLDRVLSRLLDDIPLWTLSLPEDTPFRAIGSVKALRKAALDFRNCIARSGRISACLAGRSIYLQYAARDCRAIVGLEIVARHGGRVIARIDDILGVGNRDIGKERAAAVDALRRIPGLELTHMSLDHTCLVLSRGSRSGSEPDDDEFDLAFLLDEEEELLGAAA